MCRNHSDNLRCEVAMRVNNGHSLSLANVGIHLVEQEIGFARPRAADDIHVAAPVGVSQANRASIASEPNATYGNRSPLLTPTEGGWWFQLRKACGFHSF